MDKVSVTMRVLFEEPFWIGVLERVTENGLSVCKFPFGAEPKDYEVYGFLMENYYRLRFSPAVEFSLREMQRSSKRRQKEAGRQTAAVGIGTKSQQAAADAEGSGENRTQDYQPGNRRRLKAPSV